VGLRPAYDPATDLVLTYDFGLRKEIESTGGEAHYVDRLVDPAVMQAQNKEIYRFLGEWHRDAEGNDIFKHLGVPFGFAFRLEFWNDYVFYVRACLCLERVLALSFKELLVGTSIGIVERILEERRVKFRAVGAVGDPFPSYFFPIHAWMQANIRRRGLKAAAIGAMSSMIGRARQFLDGIGAARHVPAVFLQEYYPTATIAARLRAEGRVRVVVPGPTRSNPVARHVPLPRRAVRHRRQAGELMEAFRAHQAARFILLDGTDITAGVFRIIEERIGPQLPDAIRTLEGVVRYVDRDPLRLIILIANIGDVVTIVDCVCRARGIPSYLIINGLLCTDFGDESKYATTINAYSTTIRDYYFRGMSNIVCLGDPRMDAYPSTLRRPLDPDRFTVTIGAAGHNPTDLNSHAAVEFDFLHDVLAGIRRVKVECPALRVIVKVRANGYREQYEQFTREYFPGLVDEIIDKEPIDSVLERTNFYISIYSQTLFEASCKGIPVLYYQVADYYKHPPFDGKSSLVTAGTVEGVVDALQDARKGHARFDAFLDRGEMERFVGPLDGRNTERNMQFIYDLLADRAGDGAA
jgi:hypothetical protein